MISIAFSVSEVKIKPWTCCSSGQNWCLPVSFQTLPSGGANVRTFHVWHLGIFAWGWKNPKCMNLFMCEAHHSHKTHMIHFKINVTGIKVGLTSKAHISNSVHSIAQGQQQDKKNNVSDLQAQRGWMNDIICTNSNKAKNTSFLLHLGRRIKVTLASVTSLDWESWVLLYWPLHKLFEYIYEVFTYFNLSEIFLGHRENIILIRTLGIKSELK